MRCKWAFKSIEEKPGGDGFGFANGIMAGLKKIRANVEYCYLGCPSFVSMWIGFFP